MASLWRLTVRSEFSSSHALRHYQGKCESLHGHNFSVEATVEGGALSASVEYLVDFSYLKKALNRVLDGLDHKDLNSTPPFDVLNPTSENLARFIYQELQPLVAEHGVRVYSITVGEKSTQCATYLEICE